MKRMAVIAAFFAGILCAPAHSQDRPLYYKITIDGPINAVMHEYVQDGLRRAADAQGLIIKLDTPGGPYAKDVQNELRRYSGHLVTYADRKRLPSSVVDLLSTGDHRGVHPRTQLLLPDNDNEAAVERNQPHVFAAYRALEAFAQRILADMFYGVLNRGATGRPIDQSAARQAGLFDHQTETLEGLLDTLGERPEIRPYGLSGDQWIRSWLIHPDFVYVFFILSLCLLGGGYYAEDRRMLGAGSVSLAVTFYGLLMLPVNYLAFIVFGLGAFMLLLDVVIPSLGIFTAVGTFLFYAGSVTIFAHPAFAVSFYLIMGVIASIVVGFSVAWVYYMMFAME